MKDRGIIVHIPNSENFKIEESFSFEINSLHTVILDNHKEINTSNAAAYSFEKIDMDGNSAWKYRFNNLS